MFDMTELAVTHPSDFKAGSAVVSLRFRFGRPPSDMKILSADERGRRENSQPTAAAPALRPLSASKEKMPIK